MLHNDTSLSHTSLGFDYCRCLIGVSRYCSTRFVRAESLQGRLFEGVEWEAGEGLERMSTLGTCRATNECSQSSFRTKPPHPPPHRSLTRWVTPFSGSIRLGEVADEEHNNNSTRALELRANCSEVLSLRPALCTSFHPTPCPFKRVRWDGHVVFHTNAQYCYCQ